MVLLMPVVLLLTFLPIQAGVWYHARQVVTAAAQEGARAARVADLSVGEAQNAGAERAARFAAGLGGRAVTGTAVHVRRSQTQVTVLVTGHAMSLLPWGGPAVSGTSTAPVDRWSPP
jgi:Flp pilus assembly protein TadG